MSTRESPRRSVKKRQMSFPPKELSRWKLEADLFSSIATMNFLAGENEKGEVDPNIYHRQLKTLLKNAIQARIELSDLGFHFENFLSNERVNEEFPKGLAQLRIVDGTETGSLEEKDVVLLDYSEMRKLSAKSADFVTSTIELLDLIRLGSLGTVDRLLPLLDEIQNIFSTTTLFGSDHAHTKEVEDWIRNFEREKPGTLPRDPVLKRLETEASRWLNAFRAELRNL